ncbi:MAG: YbhB/YbcL family Raf kinase inhibitor-like protein [Chitinophagales bacterium]|nr:YbhB/YbcL family Raf kinase inhibitor-like protein [Chitinophagales bacterium]
MKIGTNILYILIALLYGTSVYGQGLEISSSSFTHNKEMPKKFSCQGENTSPDLSINNLPAKTESIAIIMHDPDAPMEGGFTHWVIWNIDVQDFIPEDFKGGMQGLNSAGKSGYIGMCPPTGTHHYHFYVYALDTKLDISTQTDNQGLEKAMKGHVLEMGILTGLYKKEKKQ